MATTNRNTMAPVHADDVAELERTRLALDIVGKAHALLEKLSESADNE